MASSTLARRLGLTGNRGCKAPVRAATTANITLSGEQTIDGVAVVDGDRVLVWHQTSGVQNGIYDVSTGSWTRSIDANGTQDWSTGTVGVVAQGAQANQFWILTTTGDIVPDTSAMTFQVGIPTLPILAASSGAGLVGFLYGAVYGAGTIGKWLQDLALSSGASFIGFIQAGVGAVLRSIQDRMRERVSVGDFMTASQRADVIAGTALVDQSDAVQRCVNYCATFVRWPTMIVPGRLLMLSSVNIDRLVDTTLSDFVIQGEGNGSGFYTTGGVVLFDSTIAITVDPKSEFIRFQNIHFETSSIANASYVLSPKFLRVYFNNCRFALMRCMLTTIYVQTMYFKGCNIRNNAASFINCVGLYDVSFYGCVIENGSTLVRAVDAARGCNGLRIVNNVIEGIQSSVVVTTGACGFVYSDNHCESNFSPEINTFAGVMTNKSVTISGNYIYNNVGATAYHGTTDNVISFGNTVFPNILHTNSGAVTNLISEADSCVGGISDATIFSKMAGITSSGTGTRTWTDAENHFTKSSIGNIGVGKAPGPTTRFGILGVDQTAANTCLALFDSVGNSIASFRNDRVVILPAINAYANDAAAAAAGIPIGGLYRIGTALQIRVV